MEILINNLMKWSISSAKTFSTAHHQSIHSVTCSYIYSSSSYVQDTLWYRSLSPHTFLCLLLQYWTENKLLVAMLPPYSIDIKLPPSLNYNQAQSLKFKVTKYLLSPSIFDSLEFLSTPNCPSCACSISLGCYTASSLYLREPLSDS